MRSLSLFICLLPAIGTVQSQSTSQTLSFKTIEDLRKFLTRKENRYPLISAHRGGPSKGLPENAIETFRVSASRQPLIV